MENIIRNLFLKCWLWAVIGVTILGGAGCKTNSGRVSGSPDDFVVSEIQRYGGQINHRIFVHLTGDWTFQRDEFGTVMESKNADFANVDQFIRQEWGAPKPAGFTDAEDQQWVVPAREAGVSIWYSKCGNGVKLSLVKPSNRWPERPLREVKGSVLEK